MPMKPLHPMKQPTQINSRSKQLMQLKLQIPMIMRLHQLYLLNKRNFLTGYKPVILLNSPQETIASNEAANTNQLEIEAANAAQTANTYDNEAATTFLFN
ncbi:hypothetical protein G9A89_023665 [Geosiphon pyriformis]|nr:hypothetical protein G9A89_023665 [Geosiphon pyriformis]